MKTTLKKIVGITLVGVFVFSAVGFAEALGNRGYEGRALDKIGEAGFVLRDEISRRNAELPVYPSGNAFEDNSVN